jgi:hypothetical protein
MTESNATRAKSRFTPLRPGARRYLGWGALAVLAFGSLPGCLESVALDGLSRLTDAITDVGKGAISESKSWRDIVNNMPEKTKPLVEAVIANSIKSTQAAVDEEVKSLGVEGSMLIDYTEFKFQSNAQQIRDSLLDAMLIIHENGLKNEEALLEVVRTVRFRPIFPSPRFGLGPSQFVIDEAADAGDRRVRIAGYGFLRSTDKDTNWAITFKDADKTRIREVDEAWRCLRMQGEHLLLMDLAHERMKIGPTDKLLVLTYGPDPMSRFELPIEYRKKVTTPPTVVTKPAKPPRTKLDLPKLDGGTHVLEGRLGKVTIREINGKARVEIRDALEVECGLVNGESTFIVEARDGVTFTSMIDGKSRVEATTWGNLHVREKVDGKSKVTVHICNNFQVVDKIDGGPETEVVVRYFGSQSVRYVGGGARYDHTRVERPPLPEKFEE